MKTGKIFIQIASYRDNQLLSTVKDCIHKAQFPDNLVFCIAWQHSEVDKWDNLDAYANDKRFKIIDIDYRDSEGACWARNRIQQYYDGEEYTLQLDSHHYFMTNWDTQLIDMIKKLQEAGYKKPLLTAYLPSYNSEADPDERVMVPWQMNFDKFTPEGIVLFIPAVINNYGKLDGPIRCRFYSGHFCFTLGLFCIEVQHDPELYFHGEEISIAARAYTWGYDLFTPHKIIAWHEYSRKNRIKHWDDNDSWAIRNEKSLAKVRSLFDLELPLACKYGFGLHRSLAEYEKYTGICFKNRIVDIYTLNHKEPPNSESIFSLSIRIPVLLSDYKFLAIIFEDINNNPIFRQDYTPNEIISNEIPITFTYTIKPHKYIIWAHSNDNKWGNKIEKLIDQ